MENMGLGEKVIQGLGVGGWGLEICIENWGYLPLYKYNKKNGKTEIGQTGREGRDICV